MIKLKPIVTALQESSLSRVTDHMKKHDCGVVTAFRSEYSKSDNMKRNIKLRAMIASQGYGWTEVDGAYIENFGTPDAVESRERSLFVVDSKDTGNLKSDLLKWGELFEQDSILFIPKMSDQRDFKSGTFTGGSILVGTKKSDDAVFKYHTDYPFKDIHYGDDTQFMTKVSGRPFSFTENFIYETVYIDTYKNTNWMGKWACKTLADGDWRKINLNEEL